MSKILRYLACLFMLIFVGKALAAGYDCPDYKKYTSCKSGYYISDCGTSGWTGQTISSSSLTKGNSCIACPSDYECSGQLTCPKGSSITCSPGYYLPANSTTCTACGDNNHYCPGGDFSQSSSSQGRYTVDSGYYSTGGSSTTRTGQSQCTGSTYCSSGVQYNCPSETSGWLRGTGTGWTSYTQCYQTKESGVYCIDGLLKQTAISSSSWGTATVDVPFVADEGAYVSGSGANTTCEKCPSLTYSSGGTVTSCEDVDVGYYSTGCSSSGDYCTGQSQCPSGYRDIAATSQNECVGTFQKLGEQIVPDMQTGCENRTLTSCNPGTCDYTKKYSGTIVSDCTPTNCTQGQTCTYASEDYYLDSGVAKSCRSLNSSYPYSDGGNIAYGRCYYWKTVYGDQIPCATPSGCSGVTCNSCTPGSCQYKYHRTGADDVCTPSDCQQEGILTVTVGAGYYVKANAASCTACGGNNYYCPGGTYDLSSSIQGRKTVSSGYYSTGGTSTTRTNQSLCEAGYYCSSGVRNPCSGSLEYQNSTGQTSCKTVSTGYYKNSNSSQLQCPSGYRDIAATSKNECLGTFQKTGTEQTPAMQTGCENRTLTSCNPGTCDYTKKYSGTIVSDCTPTNCTKDQTCTYVSENYYLDDGVAKLCSSMDSNYPYSDGGNIEYGRCYYWKTVYGEQTPCSVPSGCYSASCGTCNPGSCEYKYHKTGADDVCTPNDCQQPLNSVSAKAGRYVSGKTCPLCDVGTFQGTNGSTATSCQVCSGNTYAASQGATSCTSCPSSYTISGTTAAAHDEKSDCVITCAAGTQVVTADATCTTPADSWYSAQHTVSAGSTSGTNVKDCLTNYYTPSTTLSTDHDASSDCKISCGAGTRITSVNATSCTTPSGNWYIGAHSVSQGSISSVNTCLSNYTITGTAAGDHDQASDCKISCAGGSYLATANSTSCSAVGAGYWAAASVVSQGSAGVRNSCDSGLTTIGFGAGADEAGDCGRVLNVNGGKIYLRSDKKTTPSLNVSINGTTFYGNMGASTIGSLKINSGGVTYSVYDESME